MITPTSISEQLLFTTLRIQAEGPDGEMRIGTGCCVHFPCRDDSIIPVVLAPRDLIAGTVLGRLLLHEAEVVDGQARPSGRFIEVNIDAFADRWIPHPDPAAPFCALPLQPIHTQVEEMGKAIFTVALPDEILPSAETLAGLNTLEMTLVLCYLRGLDDTVNNLPLQRRAMTATHPAVAYEGRPEGLLELAPLPGTAGAPVFIVNEEPYYDKTGTRHAEPRVLLLGFLYAAPFLDAEGEVTIQSLPTTGELDHRRALNLAIYLQAHTLRPFGAYLQTLTAAPAG